MASISSLSSINGLNLWLDATDLSTFVTTFSQSDVLQWNDKSSNAYQFVPVRLDSRPILSTSGTSSVAVLFNQTSSFHLLSKQKIPANSTLDFFAVLTPYSLWGPRQPIFDSADITVAETDTRFNTQIYADGNEFFRSITAANTYPPTQYYPGYATQTNWPNAFQGTAIYKGNLLVGQSQDLILACNSTVPGLNLCNYLQIYNRRAHQFEVWNYPMGDMNTKALAVYDNKLFATTFSTLSIYYPGDTKFSMPSTFMSTTFGSLLNTNASGQWGYNQWFFNNQGSQCGFSGGGPLCVYKRELYAATYAGWLNYYVFTNSAVSQCNWTPQLYKWSNSTSTISLVTHLRYGYYNSINSGTFYNQLNRGLMPFRGDMYITGQIYNFAASGFMFRFNNQYNTQFIGTNSNYFNNFSLAAASSYPAIYYGSMILPIDGQSQRLYKFNDNQQLQNFGRTNFVSSGPYAAAREEFITAGGGMCTYKGSLWLQRASQISGSNTYGANYVEIYTGPTGGTYSNATVKTAGSTPVQCNQNNLMIVHDGKLFINAWSSNVIYEWGNGTSLDQPFSTLVGAPILLQIRKTPTYSQMYLNGTLVENQLTPSFTFNEQPVREMWVGGAAGTMCGGMSDPGSDHMEGAIHTIAQYNQVLSTTDRQKVEGILAWTYGIQAVLPASHPYRNSRP